MTSAFCPIQPVPSRVPHSPCMIFRCALQNTRSKSDQQTPAPSLETNFSTWAQQNNVDLSAISLTSFHTDNKNSPIPNRGMIVSSPLKKGDQLISVARNATLQVTSLDRRRTPLPSKISQSTWQSLPWYARLALLILEARVDPHSKWKPWIETLPTSFDTPFHWTESQLSELQSPRMVELVHDQRKLYRKLYNDINSGPANSLARSISYADFVWAVECVRSRAFSGPLEVAPFKQRLRLFLFIGANTFAWPTLHVLPWENALNGGLTALFALAMYDIITPKILKIVQGVELLRYAMTPGIDFINHNSSMAGKAEVSYEYFTEKFVVAAGEDYQVGNQVFISYGKQSNDSFLQYYGFVEDNNPAETYVFSPKIENAMRVPEGTLVARMPSGFDDKTIGKIGKAFGGKKDSARRALSELCAAELGSMPTTLEEDSALLREDKCAADSRLTLALRYRIQKKKLLAKGIKLIVQGSQR